MALAVTCLSASASTQEAARIDLEHVTALARERAMRPFRPSRVSLPEALGPERLDYPRYQRIGFRHDRALWLAEGLPFRLEFFHPGYLFSDPVQVHEFSATHVQRVRFAADLFDYGGIDVGWVPPDLGYAGVRIACELDPSLGFSELGAFLGSSYYRLLGQGQSYGASARALSVDCGYPDRREEFPVFTDWWIGKPRPDAETLRMYGLLDSIGFTGAFSFTIRPGGTTTADVEAVVFARGPEQGIATLPSGRGLGLAPLTSMFGHGENSEEKLDDYRQEVHDSDGLLIHTAAGEWVWRPLSNVAEPRRQQFAGPIRGFGLMQRDRDFASYQDLFVAHHRAPSIWNEPLSDWGEGSVQLIELRADADGADNVVALWEPAQKPAPLQPYRYAYRQSWTLDVDAKLSANRVIATRAGRDPADPHRREIVIDFRGPALDALPAHEPPVAVASCSDNGTIPEVQVFRNAFARGWRVVLKVAATGARGQPIELRCALRNGKDWVSETWAYRWTPRQ